MAIRRVILRTSLPIEEVRSRLAAAVRPKSRFWSLKAGYIEESSKAALFAGNVDERTFKITRIISYRNSFLPVIRGRIEAGAAGTEIRILMHLHPFVAAFMLAWFIGVAPGGLASLTAAKFGPEAFMFLFGLILTIGGFLPESFKAEKLLRKLLAAA